MAIEFDKLHNLIAPGADEAQRRSVLSTLADSSDPRAKEILEILAKDKNTAIKMLASSYLKKNFSDGAQASSHAPQPAHHQSGPSSAVAAAPLVSSAPSTAAPGAEGMEKFKAALANMDIQAILESGITRTVVFPLLAIVILGLFSPLVPAFFFFAGFLAIVVTISLFNDKHIAIPAVAGVCLVSMTLYGAGLIVNFKPTFPLMLVYIGIGVFITVVTTELRLDIINVRASNEEFKTQLLQLKKLIDKRKDYDETQKDMDQVTKMKNDLTARSRRLGETLMQIHELISCQKTEDIVDRVTKLMTRQLGTKSVSVWVLNSKFHTVYPVGVSEKHIAPQKYMNMNIPVEEETIVTKICREGGFYTAEDFKKMAEYEPFSDEFEIKSEFAVSMDAGNKIIGVINCEEYTESFELNDDSKRLIKLISDVSAWALKNAGDLELSQRDLQNIKQLSEREREEKKKIRGIFDKFVSPKVIEEIMNNPASLALGGKRRPTTLFFADIRGFTSMSESMADKPEVVLDVVNRFHSSMTEIIIAKGGTIDKYIGDALMALFGAPISSKVADDAFNAIDAAVAIRKECQKIREQLIKEGKTAVNVGIGINTGDAVIGMVGSTKMMNYTAIGDTVNTAARIEANAGAGQVLISRSTYELVRDRIQVNILEPIMVKGKKEPVEIFEVINVLPQA